MKTVVYEFNVPPDVDKRVKALAEQLGIEVALVMGRAFGLYEMFVRETVSGDARLVLEYKDGSKKGVTIP